MDVEQLPCFITVGFYMVSIDIASNSPDDTATVFFRIVSFHTVCSSTVLNLVAGEIRLWCEGDEDWRLLQPSDINVIDDFCDIFECMTTLNHPFSLQAFL